jgi:transketolase N-terminal domain/subunit
MPAPIGRGLSLANGLALAQMADFRITLVLGAGRLAASA